MTPELESSGRDFGHRMPCPFYYLRLHGGETEGSSSRGVSEGWQHSLGERSHTVVAASARLDKASALPCKL